MPFIIAALIGGAGAIIGGAEAASGAKKAAKTQAGAADQAAQVQQNIFNQTRADLGPFIGTGGTALTDLYQNYGLGVGGSGVGPNNAGFLQNFGGGPGGTGVGPGNQGFFNEFGVGPAAGISGMDSIITNGVGLGPGQGGIGGFNAPFSPDLSSLAATPGYQFALQQGQQGLGDLFSTGQGGGVHSGNFLKALSDYNQGLASQQFGAERAYYTQNQQQRYQQTSDTLANMFSRGLAGEQVGFNQGLQVSQLPFENALAVATLGENAAAGAGTIGAQTGQNIGNSLIGAGNAISAGQIAASNAASNAITGVTGGISNALLMSQLFGGGQGGFGNYLMNAADNAATGGMAGLT